MQVVITRSTATAIEIDVELEGEIEADNLAEAPDVLKNFFGSDEHGCEVLSAITDKIWYGVN